MSNKSKSVQTVPHWQWVKPEVGTGCMCGIETGGIVSEIGRHNDKVLVRYTQPKQGSGFRTACRGKEVFWLDAKDFDTMTQRREQAVKDKAANDEIVMRLINDD